MDPMLAVVKTPRPGPLRTAIVGPKVIDWRVSAAILRQYMRGRTQTEVGSKVGLDPSTLSSILSGARRPSLAAFGAICRELRVPPDQITAMLGATPPSQDQVPRVAEPEAPYAPDATAEVTEITEIVDSGTTLTVVVKIAPRTARRR